MKDFNLINNTDSLYSRVIPVQYPKAGEANSAARVGVVSAAGGPTRWLDIAGDPRNHYIARMDWAASSDEVMLQRLNRLQNTNEVMLGDARTGAGAHRFSPSGTAPGWTWWTTSPGSTAGRASPG